MVQKGDSVPKDAPNSACNSSRVCDRLHSRVRLVGHTAFSPIRSAAIAGNGNLTYDGLLQFGYDAWSRLVTAQRKVDTTTTTIATYRYFGDTRRASKAVQNCGPAAGPFRQTTCSR